MHFIKKNLIFLLISLGFLVVMGVFAGMYFSAKSELKSIDQKVSKTEAKISEIIQKGLALTTDNAKMAEANAKGMEAGFVAMGNELERSYAFELHPLGADAFSVLNNLRNEMNALKKEVEAKGVECPEAVNGFTFQNLIQSTTPPNLDLVRLNPKEPEKSAPLLYSVEAVKYLVRLTGESGIARINKISHPLLLSNNLQWRKKAFRDNESFYLWMPVEITLTGTDESLQKYVDALLAPHAKHFVVIRSISVYAKENFGVEAADYEKELRGDKSQVETFEFDEPPPDQRTTRRLPRRKITRSVLEMGGERVTLSNVSSTAEENLVPVPETKNDYLAFTKKTVTWKIFLNVYRFWQPEQGTQDAEGNE